MDFEVTYTPDLEAAGRAYQLSGGKKADIMRIVRLAAAAVLAVVFTVAFVKSKELVDLLLAAVAAAFCVAELLVADKFKSEKLADCCEAEEITVKVSENGLEFIYPTGKEVRDFKKMKRVVKKDGLYSFRFKEDTDFRYIPEDALGEENKARLEELLRGISCYEEF